MGNIGFFWNETPCRRIRLLAVAFGLGPRVAANDLAESMGWELGAWREPLSPDVKIPEAEVLLNFGVTEEAAKQPARLKIWVDPLVWLRSQLPEAILDYNLVLAERFFPAPRHPVQVPIVEVRPALTKLHWRRSHSGGGPVIVSFGGIGTPHSTSIHTAEFPAVLLRSLAKASARHNRRVVCCLPEQYLGSVTERAAAFPGLSFLNPNRARFLELLTEASLYVVQPGLYGPFEGFILGLPMALLPPFSYTQFAQTERYRLEEVLGSVPLLDELAGVVGHQRLVFGDEQRTFFRLLEAWYRDRGKSPEVAAELDDWADDILAFKSLPEALTDRRCALALDALRAPCAASVLKTFWSGFR